MAYNKTTWVDNSLPSINQTNLNKIEDGIGDAHNHMSNTNNPHAVNQADVGLGNVNNTNDVSKPVSTATQAALNSKSDIGHVHDGADAIDHSDLLNIGTNTHAQIDTKLDQALYESDALSAVDDANKLITENELNNLTTDDITEASNLYYTDVRADDRIQNTIQDDISSVSTLYSSNRIESLIESSLIYQGQWDADTNTPTLIDGTGTKGYFYTVSVAGTQDLGNGAITFNVNDKITYDGTNWNRSTSSTNIDWGNINGTLSSQTDLQTALDLKTDYTVFDTHATDTMNPHDVTYALLGGTQPAPIAHTHTESDITDLDKYTQLQVDTAIDTVQNDVNAHEALTDNPHSVTQTQIGLGNVNNTADVDKPVSMDTQTQLDLKVVWKGEWVGATYYENDMVRDGAYTMIANKETTDRPSPQDVGYGGYFYSGTLTPYEQSAKQIIFGTRYVAATAIKLTSYRVDVIAGNEYHLYSIINPLTEPIVNQLNSFVADTTGWITIAGTDVIVGNGFTFDIICEVIEPAGTPTVTALNYDYDTPNNAGTPGVGQIEHSNADTASLLVRKTDDDANDNSTFLEGLTVGDIIELDTVRWTIQGVTDDGTYMTYQISPAVQYGSDGVASFNFETVTATPITVGYELDYNLTTSASGLYIVDGKYTDIVPDNNQYGIDIEVQEISISPDWEVVATSISTGSGGEGGATIEIVDDLITQDSSKALSANQGYVLDNAKVANGRVLTDVPSNAVFVDTTYNTTDFLASSDPVIAGSITEGVYNLSGVDIDASNGTIQSKTISNNITFTESLLSGQYITVRLVDGDLYTVTWFTVSWVGKVAPTLTANDIIVFWKEGGTVYGNYVGAV